MPGLRSKGLVGAVAYADGQFDDARYAVALVATFVKAGGEALNYARATALSRNDAGKVEAVEVTDQLTQSSFRIRARAFVNATGPFSDAIRQLASATAEPRMRPSKGVHILFPLDGFSESDALLVPKTEDGRVIFAIPWNGRLLVGTTDTGYSPGEEMVVTREEIDYLLRQLNPYLEAPLGADQVVSGYAGIRPLVAAKGVSDTKKLIRDDEIEFDAASGLVSILGGKWTTHRLMGQETIDKVQEHLGVPLAPSPTPHHPLAGSEGYAPDYWQRLVSEHRISGATAHHLARKYGTLAPEVLGLAKAEPLLGELLVSGAAPIRAQVVYSVRHEMARTVEDVLARRIGLQLFDWRLAVRAAPVVAALLREELGWTADEERAAAGGYIAKINHMLSAAGYAAEPVLPAERVMEGVL
jgi:glycerol-3-phosphate dehydrogenase